MADQNMLKNNNGAKVIYGMLAILALIGGMSAIVLLMQQSINNLREVVLEHRKSKGHSPTTAVLAAIKEDFKEVETQFSAMRELFSSKLDDAKDHRMHIDARVTERGKIIRELEGLLLRTHERLKSNIEQMVITARWIREHDLKIPGTDAAQWERIRALERQVYGAPQAIIEGKGH